MVLQVKFRNVMMCLLDLDFHIHSACDPFWSNPTLAGPCVPFRHGRQEATSLAGFHNHSACDPCLVISGNRKPAGSPEKPLTSAVRTGAGSGKVATKDSHGHSRSAVQSRPTHMPEQSPTECQPNHVPHVQARPDTPARPIQDTVLQQLRSRHFISATPSQSQRQQR